MENNDLPSYPADVSPLRSNTYLLLLGDAFGIVYTRVLYYTIFLIIHTNYSCPLLVRFPKALYLISLHLEIYCYLQILVPYFLLINTLEFFCSNPQNLYLGVSK